MAVTAQGRPRGFESRRRTSEFLRLVADGQSMSAAAAAARVKPARVLRLLDEPEFWQVVAAIRAGERGPTAVMIAEAAA